MVEKMQVNCESRKNANEETLLDSLENYTRDVKEIIS